MSVDAGALSRFLVGASLCVACSGPFDDTSDVRIWATTASAPAIYAHAYQPISVVDGRSGFADPDCPVIRANGEAFDIEGGCSEAGGRAWVGAAQVSGGGQRERWLTWTSLEASTRISLAPR